ncbi:MAG: 16S rRNA pseudouridine(516) synthase [Limnobacter sp.]|uniref:16S rRNA pseudouridine(516) synthase n=1 Tax=Limnobacter sp. TaxID=2003368 RepID=UPI00391C4432
MKVHPNIKTLQTQGLGNRRHCENILASAELLLNGSEFDPFETLIQEGDTLEIDGTAYQIRRNVYVMLHKPAGYETSHKPSRHRSVFELLPPHYVARGIQAAGRLDVDTTGLLILTDDGQFLHRLISGKRGDKHAIEKIYQITPATPVTSTQLDHLLAGVELQEDYEVEVVKASRCEVLDDGRLEMGITTGKYHQVKRMLAAVGNHVTALHRHSVGPYVLPDNLAAGAWCDISPDAFDATP